MKAFGKGAGDFQIPLLKPPYPQKKGSWKKKLLHQGWLTSLAYSSIHLEATPPCTQSAGWWCVWEQRAQGGCGEKRGCLSSRLCLWGLAIKLAESEEHLCPLFGPGPKSMKALAGSTVCWGLPLLLGLLHESHLSGPPGSSSRTNPPSSIAPALLLCSWSLQIIES